MLEGGGDEKESPAPPVQIPFLTPLFACFCVFRWMGGEIEWERKNGRTEERKCGECGDGKRYSTLYAVTVIRDASRIMHVMRHASNACRST